jgi:hypothetical protein
MTANDDKKIAYLSYVSKQKKQKKKFIHLLKGGD